MTITTRHLGRHGLAIAVAIAFVVTLAMIGVARLPESAAARASAGSASRGSFAGQVSIAGGRKLYLRCAGTGRPTVILESGIHDSSDPWTLTDTEPPVIASPSVFSGVASYTHVCMYDRPGTIRYTNPPALTTRSTPVPMPRTLPSMVADLHALSKRAHVPGPYVLVAHSYGGLIVRLFASTYPSQIAGLVLVDAFAENIRRLFGPHLWPRYVELLNHPGTALDDLPGFETFDVDETIHAIQTAKPLPRVPLAVISKTQPFATAPTAPRRLTTRLEKVWPQVQQHLVELQPQTPHVFATGSDHYVQIHDPDLTIATIRLILDRARHHRAGAALRR
jgi:pimeloyl-ACP methyl ester carboxylesterase